MACEEEAAALALAQADYAIAMASAAIEYADFLAAWAIVETRYSQMNTAQDNHTYCEYSNGGGYMSKSDNPTDAEKRRGVREVIKQAGKCVADEIADYAMSGTMVEKLKSSESLLLDLLYKTNG